MIFNRSVPVDLTTIELAYLHIVNLTKTFIERAKKMKGEADERMQKRREKGEGRMAP